MKQHTAPHTHTPRPLVPRRPFHRALQRALIAMTLLGAGATVGSCVPPHYQRATADGECIPVASAWSSALGSNPTLIISHDTIYRCTCDLRMLGGADENRALGGADEARALGGADENRALGGADEARALGGADENRALGGADEARALGGADEARGLGGLDGNLTCSYLPPCTGYVVSGSGPLWRVEQGQRVPLEGRCVPR